MVANNNCELFLCFPINNTIEFFLELHSDEKKETKATTLIIGNSIRSDILTLLTLLRRNWF